MDRNAFVRRRIEAIGHRSAGGFQFERGVGGANHGVVKSAVGIGGKALAYDFGPVHGDIFKIAQCGFFEIKGAQHPRAGEGRCGRRIRPPPLPAPQNRCEGQCKNDDQGIAHIVFIGQTAWVSTPAKSLDPRRCNSYSCPLPLLRTRLRKKAKSVEIPPVFFEKADALIEALGYIQRFNEKIVVVKLGGSFMDNDAEFKKVLTDVVFMQAVGMRPIVVHGGGKAITDAMKKAGLQAQFVQGRRYTDQRTLAIAEHVLCNDINGFIVSTINALGGKAMPLTSLTSTALFAEKMFLAGEGDGHGQEKIDIGQVGQVTWVNAPLLLALCVADFIPVIAPIARDAAGEKLNVNADTAAGHVAAATQAEKLVLVSDTHGIREKKDDPNSLLRSITKPKIQNLIAQKEISEGMLPKVESCIIALDAGVKKAHIIDGRFPHSLLLEIYSDQGVGTEILLG